MISSDYNKARWDERSTAGAYLNADGLFPAEIALIAQLRSERADWRVLDIGVGSGRTAPYLTLLGRSYVGLDYSTEMVSIARTRFPGLDIRHMDARDLAELAAGDFDLVWFSFNGIDYVSHEDRLKILIEIHRVLAPSGVFCFSTHNRDFARLAHIIRVQPPVPTSNPLRYAVRTLRYLKAQINSRRLKPRELVTDDYCLLNDDAHHHKFLTYYISVQAQVAQLERLGYVGVRAFGKEGQEIDLSSPYSADYMVHYSARR